MPNNEMLKFLTERINSDSTGKVLERAIEDLLDKLIAPDTTQGTGCDNMTAILIVLKK